MCTLCRRTVGVYAIGADRVHRVPLLGSAFDDLDGSAGLARICKKQDTVRVFNSDELSDKRRPCFPWLSARSLSRLLVRGGGGGTAAQPAAAFYTTMNLVYDALVEAVKHIPGSNVEHNKYCVSTHFRNCAPEVNTHGNRLLC